MDFDEVGKTLPAGMDVSGAGLALAISTTLDGLEISATPETPAIVDAFEVLTFGEMGWALLALGCEGADGWPAETEGVEMLCAEATGKPAVGNLVSGRFAETAAGFDSIVGLTVEIFGGAAAAGEECAEGWES